MYSFHHDPAGNVLHMTVEGQWTVATIIAFGAEAMARGALIRARYGQHAMLVDARRLPVQSPAITSHFSALLPRARTVTNGPLAAVCSSMLLKLQFDRVMSGPDVRAFLDHDEACAWIAERMASRAAA